MKEINNPHDKFFKKIMTNKESAKNILKNYLPKKVLKYLDLNDFELEKDTMIEKELEEVFSDLLYKVKINDKEAYLYLLFEHKSYPYKKITLQLMKYMRNIWELKTKDKNQTKLPLIIPIVFYHGNKKWNIGLNLSDLLEDIPKELKEYIPDFKYILYDFSKYGNEEIKGKIEERVVLLIFRYIFSDDEELLEKLVDVLILLEQISDKETAMEYFEIIIKYIMGSRESITEEALVKVANQISVERSEHIMTIAERLRKEGMRQGIIQGKKEGKKEGKLETAKAALKKGLSIDVVADITGLDLQKIEQLKKELMN